MKNRLDDSEELFSLANAANPDGTVDLLDVLLDHDNQEPITLKGEDGRVISFEQIAVIPHEVDGENELFVILKPIDKIEGINDDEAIVFIVDTDDFGNAVLRVEEDDETAVEVFNEFQKLVERAESGEDD